MFIKKLIFALGYFAFALPACFGQDVSFIASHLYNEDAIKSSASTIGQDTGEISPQISLKSHFIAFDVYQTDASAIFAYSKRVDQKSQFSFRLGEQYNWDITIEPHDLRASNYISRSTQNNIVKTAADIPCYTYKGFMNDQAKGEVRLSMGPKGISGFVTQNGQRYFIDRKADLLGGEDTGQIVVYREADVLFSDIQCGANETHHYEERLNTSKARASCDGQWELEIATAATFSRFESQDSDVNATNNSILEILNLVEPNYEPFKVSFKVVEQVVFDCSTCTPWGNSNNPGTMIDEFTDWGPTGFSQEHDEGICFYDGAGSGTVGIAWLSAICRNIRYAVVDLLRSNTGNRVLVAHEMGHNFGADHDENGAPYIMAPSVGSSTVFSPASISAIESHIDSRNCLDCITTEPTTAFIRSNLILEGLYIPETGLMRTELAAQSLLPTSQPYNTAPYNYEGNETLTNPDSMTVDWILVEARSSTDPKNVVARKAALLYADGSIRETDGTEGLRFEGLTSGNYYLAVYHRSHLGIISSQVIEFSETASAYDFRTSDGQAIGSEQLKNLGSIFGLHAGDFDGNGLINNLDYNIWKLNNASINQYLNIDGDGNGVVNNLDYNLWAENKSKIGEASIQLPGGE